MARWLLRARDLSGEDKIPLTQEFLSQMLGVQRTFVSDVANNLHKLGLIGYTRGIVQITNMQGLRDEACECYAIVKSHYELHAPCQTARLQELSLGIERRRRRNAGFLVISAALN